MLVNRTLVALDSPAVQTIAEGFAMPVVLARAWTEMTLAAPHGVDAVHDAMERCIQAADEVGEAAAAARYRAALGRFDALCGLGIEAPEAAVAEGIEHGTVCPMTPVKATPGTGKAMPGGGTMPPLPAHDGGWRHGPM